jgi:hypothetical protein
MNNTSSSMKLKNLCNTIMNMDSRVRFVGVLDNKNTRLIEGGMRKSILPLLPAHKNDLFYLRIVSHLEELKDFKNTLGDTSYVFIKMDKISFVIMSLNEEEEEEKNNMTLLISMEPDVDPSFIIPSIRNFIID